MLESLCSVLAALALFGIMVLTFVDVLGRKFLSASVTGSLELTELLMVVVIFAALPLVSLKGEHVVFDSLDPWVPAPLRRVQQAAVDVLSLVLLLGLAWLLWVKAGQMGEYGDTTAQIKLPLSPFVYLMSLLCAVTACIHGVLAWRPVQHHHTGTPESLSDV